MNPKQTLKAMYSMVRQFSEAFDVKGYAMAEFVPHKTVLLRKRLIEEECNEYETATTPIDVLDGLCDSLYVSLGTNYVCGVAVNEMKSEFPPTFHVKALTEELGRGLPCHKRMSVYLSLYNTALLADGAKRGFKMLEAFTAVHENNMEKLWPERPTSDDLIFAPKGDKFLVLRKSDGKVMKPAGHKKVNLENFI